MYFGGNDEFQKLEKYDFEIFPVKFAAKWRHKQRYMYAML